MALMTPSAVPKPAVASDPVLQCVNTFTGLKKQGKTSMVES
jgi:hypothetical protein